ncbi:MAG: aminoacyl-tRNA hydrolase [Candidatus Brocadiae bacterium]|nr:aminoacyl-tRNA hydrolase [Candidatus Brocadiia bacterium]
MALPLSRKRRTVDDLVVTDSWTIPATALQIHFARGGGPGGQNVNKLNTKAELRARLADLAFPRPEVEARFRERWASRITAAGEVLIVSQVHRSQAQNLEDCLARLTALLRAALVAPKVRRPTRPTRGSKERRIEAKRHQSKKRRDRGVDE